MPNPVGRPAGAVRLLMRGVAAELLATRPHATSRELVEQTVLQGAGRDVARMTLKSMVKVGELRAVGHERASGSRRPLTTYALPTEPHATAEAAPAWALLARAMAAPAAQAEDDE